MTTVTCQYSGLEFEAKSSRAKNHPRLADLLSQAHRADRYGEMVEALQAVRKVGGYTTIEEYLALLSQHQATAAARRGELAEKRRAAEAESKRNFAELQQRRRERNAALKAAGFRWEGDWGEENFDEYEEPSGRPPTHWYLIAPDGKQIAEEKAVAIVAGETTLEVVRAAEGEAKREAARQAAEAEAEEAAERQREADARRQVETIEVEQFDLNGFERVYERMYNPRVSSSNIVVYAGTVNGIPAGAVHIHRSYGNDFDEDDHCYCADPEAAGLTRVERPAAGNASLDFFG